MLLPKVGTLFLRVPEHDRSDNLVPVVYYKYGLQGQQVSRACQHNLLRLFSLKLPPQVILKNGVSV